jgi:ketol-acid reductoisomerase
MSAGDDIVAPLLLANLQHSNIIHTAVYGAGELGAQVLQLLREQGITVSVVIDRRAAAGSFELDGLPVVTLAEAFSRGERVFAVASKVFANEIISEIQHKYSMYEPVVISYLGLSPMKIEA